MTNSAVPLSLENAKALLRKISINVLNQDADATLFTLPLEGIALDRAALNRYLGMGTFESFFNQDAKTKLYSPMPWVARLPKGEIALEDEFQADGAEILTSVGKPLVFERGDSEGGEDGEAAPAVRIHTIRLKPQVGGITLLSCHLQVRPGLGKENLALQEHQFRTITVTVGDLQLAQRKGKQQVLNFGEGAESEASAGVESEDATLEEFEAAATKQVEAAKAKRGQVIDGRSERVKELDRKRGRSAPETH